MEIDYMSFVIHLTSKRPINFVRVQRFQRVCMYTVQPCTDAPRSLIGL